MTKQQATAPPVGIYPELPAGLPDHHFRLQEISQLRKHLEDERDKCSQLYKKYRRGANALDCIDKALLTASMGLGIRGWAFYLPLLRLQ